ncbi:MAG: metal-sensitive transcriptional regulator [Anaerolineales bacterium]|nr:metal-sensitive transcriptional regulator [Anaerolineales bacterium]
MDEKHKAETLRRLRSIKGHVSGIERMLEEDAYCIDVIKQIQAVQAALNKVSVRLLDNHLRSCVVTAVNSRSAKERERVLAEIADVFETATKV